MAKQMGLKLEKCCHILACGCHLSKTAAFWPSAAGASSDSNQVYDVRMDHNGFTQWLSLPWSRPVIVQDSHCQQVHTEYGEEHGRNSKGPLA
jgi:hypothetical protein